MADRKGRGSPGDDLAAFVKVVRRRILADRLLSSLTLDLFVALCAVAALVLVDRLLWPGAYFHGLALVAVALAVVVAAARTLLARRISAFDAAAAADHQLALQERIASACYARARLDEAARGGASVTGTQAEWEHLIVDDARKSLQGVNAAEAFPVGPRRAALWLFAPLVAWGALFLWVPSVDPFGIGREQAEAEEVSERVEQRRKKLDEELEELMRKAAERESPEVQKLLEMLAREIERPRKKENEATSQKGETHAKGEREAHREALLEVARREDAIRKGLERDAFKDLKKALDELRGLQTRKDDLTRALQGALKDGDLAKASKELAKLGKKLSELSRKKPSELTPEEKKMLERLQKELARLARSSPSLGQLSKGLHGMQGLSSKDLAKMLSNLDQLAQDLDSLQQLQNDLAMLQDAMDLVRLTKEDLAKLSQHKCPNCGKNLGQKPGQPGGT